MKLLAFAALAAPLIAQDWTFPHQTHLAMGLDCDTCHSAAANSSEAGDDLLPNGALCQACHNGQTAPAIELAPLAERDPAVRTFRFDHSFHLALGEIAPLVAAAIDSGNYFGKPGDARRFLDNTGTCGACHRGLEESTEVVAGAHMPQMADCIVCHTRIDNPFSCPECHIEGANLRPADHTREFIDTHSTGKAGLDKISCQPCHGRDFGCMGCH